MKSYRQELWFEIRQRREFRNITPDVENCLRESGIRQGLCLVNAMHITASVFINDDESGLHEDYEKWLEGVAPPVTVLVPPLTVTRPPVSVTRAPLMAIG